MRQFITVSRNEAKNMTKKCTPYELPAGNLQQLIMLITLGLLNPRCEL